MSADAVLIETANGYDFQIDENGDIETADFFDTAILMSLFCERRATASEMPESHRRRGWIGNEQGDFEIGSKLWLFEQEKETRTILSGLEKAAFNGLKWLIDDGYAISIQVKAEIGNSIDLTVIIETPGSKVEKRFYDLWKNTGTRDLVEEVLDFTARVANITANQIEDGDITSASFIATTDLKFITLSPLNGQISIDPFIGIGAPTFTRSSTAYEKDFENFYRLIPANEARLSGARRVENVATQSVDFTDADWTKSNISPTATTLLATAANATTLQTYTGDGKYTLRVKMSRITGTGDIDLTVDGGSTWTTVILTGIDQILSITQSDVTNPQYGIRIVTDTDQINASEIQLEDVSGQINESPGEYIATTTSPLANHYITTNGNSVVSNVVTESAGISLHPDIFKENAAVFVNYDLRADSAAYAEADRIIIVSGSGAAGGDGKWYFIDTGNDGTSAGSEPTFDDTIGNTTVDGTATWTCGGHYTIAGGMIEESRTNVCLESRDINGFPWVTILSDPVMTKDQDGIDGKSNKAVEVEDDSITLTEGRQQSITIPDDSNTHVSSVYILKDSDTSRFPEFRLTYLGGTFQRIHTQINTQTGALNNTDTTGTVSSRVEDHRLWWRLILTVANNSSGNVTARVTMYPAYSGTLGGAADGSITGSVIVDQFQLELNTSNPSSPIVTEASSVTRSEERLTYPVSAWLDTAEGSILLDTISDIVGSNDAYLATLHDGADNNSIALLRNNGDSSSLLVKDGGVTQADITAGSPDMANGIVSKLAIAWINNDFVIYNNGVQVGTDGSGAIPTGLTTLDIGRWSGAGLFADAEIKNVRYYNNRLDNATLATLTSSE